MSAKTRVRNHTYLTYPHRFVALYTPTWCYALTDKTVGTASA